MGKSKYVYGTLSLLMGWLLLPPGLEAALVVSSGNSPVTVTFDETLTGVNEGPFAGLGWSPTPAKGQLNSEAWALNGIGGGLPFGGTSSNVALERGTSLGGVTSVGIYAFDVGNNLILGIQPGGSDFTPGSITLRVRNDTGQLVTHWNLSYDIFYYNDQLRGNRLDFSYSADDALYTSVPALDFISPAARDVPAIWSSTPRNLSLEQEIAHGESLYLRWAGDDAIGSGSRDEYGIDNIQVMALLGSQPPPNSAMVPEPSGRTVFCLLATMGVGFGSWSRRRGLAASRGDQEDGPSGRTVPL